MTSAQVDGRSIVGVVLGGVSTPARDNQMRKLVATYLPQASVRNGPGNLIAQTAPDKVAPQKSIPVAPDANAAAARMAIDTSTTKSIPAQSASYEPSQPSSETAFATITPKSSNPLVVRKAHQQDVPPNQVASIAPSYAEASTDTTLVDAVTTGSTRQKSARNDTSPDGWVIQVGVSPTKEMASDLLDNAKSKGGKVLRFRQAYAVAFGTGSCRSYALQRIRRSARSCERLQRLEEVRHQMLGEHAVIIAVRQRCFGSGAQWAAGPTRPRVMRA